jgi:chromosome segregation ATPase
MLRELHKDNQDFYMDNKHLLGIRDQLEKRCTELEGDLSSITHDLSILRSENHHLKSALDQERCKPPVEIEVIKTIELPPQVMYKPDEKTLHDLHCAQDEISHLKNQLGGLEHSYNDAMGKIHHLENQPPREVLKTVQGPPQILYKPDEKTVCDLEDAHREIAHLQEHIHGLECSVQDGRDQIKSLKSVTVTERIAEQPAKIVYKEDEGMRCELLECWETIKRLNVRIQELEGLQVHSKVHGGSVVHTGGE